jgi:hypothetical protein
LEGDALLMGRNKYVAQPSSAASSHTVPGGRIDFWRRDAATTRRRGRLRYGMLDWAEQNAPQRSATEIRRSRRESVFSAGIQIDNNSIAVLPWIQNEMKSWSAAKA